MIHAMMQACGYKAQGVEPCEQGAMHLNCLAAVGCSTLSGKPGKVEYSRRGVDLPLAASEGRPTQARYRESRPGGLESFHPGLLSL